MTKDFLMKNCDGFQSLYDIIFPEGSESFLQMNSFCVVRYPSDFFSFVFLLFHIRKDTIVSHSWTKHKKRTTSTWCVSFFASIAFGISNVLFSFLFLHLSDDDKIFHISKKYFSYSQNSQLCFILSSSQVSSTIQFILVLKFRTTLNVTRLATWNFSPLNFSTVASYDS